MFGIAAGGKGVRLGLIDDIDFWHRQLGALGEIFDHLVEFGMAGRVNLHRIVHF